MKYQEFNGIRFRQTDDGEYYVHNFSGYNIRMHRYVWSYYNGDIPDGYEVHHIDGNKGNNDISNLTLLSKSEHLKLHSYNLTEEERQWRRDNLNKNARPKAIEWHKSEEGSKWHSEHIKNQWKNDMFKLKLICDCCGKEYEGINNHEGNHFCSNACKSKFRRMSGVDDVERVCVICGRVFMSNKYKKAKCCSPKCRSMLAYRNRNNG